MKQMEYKYNYEEHIFIDYKRTTEQSGLIYLNENEKSKIDRGLKWLLKRIGSNIMKGQSIMTISLPVFLFDPRSMHEVFCYELRGAPYYLTKAYYSFDEIERMKWMVVFLISQHYITTLQLKPFNPIIGETFQCKAGNLNFYSEHTSNHPNITNFYAFDDEKLYKIHGYMEVTATTGPNSVSAMKKGKYFVTFKDGDSYEIHIPILEIKGITMGPRLLAYKDKALVLNREKDVGAFIEMNPDKVSYLKSWISTKQASFPDKFAGIITKRSNIKVSEKDCNHQLLDKAIQFSTITGEWTKEIIFDNEDKYWDIKDYSLLPFVKVGYQLPSDGRNRKDLIAVLQGNEELAQEEKEKMEVQQRVDRKLRAEWGKKK